ncbi:hypothetical protein AB0D16_15125 [Streptomyces sp. NPDC048161]|uniref:hypothetical protein n=1 Tax=Streptomyces sp. NPDC048161 TaxID=3160985 RepID=UPI0033E0DFBD
MHLSVVRGVDAGDDAFGALGLDDQPGSLGLLAASGLADEGPAGDCRARPYLTVAGVMGDLRAAGRVAHPGRRPVSFGAAGEGEAQGLARVEEAAVIRQPQVQGADPSGPQVEQFLIAALDRGSRHVQLFQLALDTGEERQPVPGSGAGGAMPGLIVAERPQGQRLIAGLVLLADPGQEEGLCSAGTVRTVPGGVPQRRNKRRIIGRPPARGWRCGYRRAL